MKGRRKGESNTHAMRTNNTKTRKKKIQDLKVKKGAKTPSAEILLNDSTFRLHFGFFGVKKRGETNLVTTENKWQTQINGGGEDQHR